MSPFPAPKFESPFTVRAAVLSISILFVAVLTAWIVLTWFPPVRIIPLAAITDKLLAVTEPEPLSDTEPVALARVTVPVPAAMLPLPMILPLAISVTSPLFVARLDVSTVRLPFVDVAVNVPPGAKLAPLTAVWPEPQSGQRALV